MKLLILLLALLISACNTYVGKNQLEAAKQLCEPNGGVYSILSEINNGYMATVNCENGAQFQFDSSSNPWKKSYELNTEKSE